MSTGILFALCFCCLSYVKTEELVIGALTQPSDKKSANNTGECKATLLGNRVVLTTKNCLLFGNNTARLPMYFQINNTKIQLSNIYPPVKQANRQFDYAFGLLAMPMKPGKAVFTWTYKAIEDIGVQIRPNTKVYSCRSSENVKSIRMRRMGAEVIQMSCKGIKTAPSSGGPVFVKDTLTSQMNIVGIYQGRCSSTSRSSLLCATRLHEEIFQHVCKTASKKGVVIPGCNDPQLNAITDKDNPTIISTAEGYNQLMALDTTRGLILQFCAEKVCSDSSCKVCDACAKHDQRSYIDLDLLKSLHFRTLIRTVDITNLDLLEVIKEIPYIVYRLPGEEEFYIYDDLLSEMETYFAHRSKRMGKKTTAKKNQQKAKVVRKTSKKSSRTTSKIGCRKNRIKGGSNTRDRMYKAHQKTYCKNQGTLPRSDGNLNLFILPVGQGDAHVIQCPNGDLFIIDFGKSPGAGWEVEQLIDFFNGQTNNIKNILITHKDEDHWNLLGNTFPNLPSLRNIYISCSTFYVDSWVNQLKTNNINPVNVEVVNNGSPCGDHVNNRCTKKIELCPGHGSSNSNQRVEAEVLFANLGNCKQPNKDSIGIKWQYNDVSVLMAGDFEGKRAQDNVANALGKSLKANVFKLSHHGADTENNKPNKEEFLDNIDPEAIFSSGNPWSNHHHPQCSAINYLVLNQKLCSANVQNSSGGNARTCGKLSAANEEQLTYTCCEGIKPTNGKHKGYTIYTTIPGMHQANLLTLKMTKNGYYFTTNIKLCY